MDDFISQPKSAQAPVPTHLDRPARGIVRGVAECVAGLRRQWQLRHDRDQLAGLSDSMLSDIGVPRGNIEHLARNGRDLGRM